MSRFLKPINLLIVVIIFACIPLIVHSPYHYNLLIGVILNATLAMTFVLLLKTGLINLSITAFWAIGAYSSALLAIKLDMSFWLCLPAAAIITGIIAFLLGFILIKNSGFVFVIMTMIIGMMIGVIIGNSSFLGGYSGIRNIPPPDPVTLPFLPAIEFTSRLPFYYLILILFVISVVICYAFYSAWSGRAWTAIGLNSRLL
jgi:branched-chain amino acid transport system permease protein